MLLHHFISECTDAADDLDASTETDLTKPGQLLTNPLTRQITSSLAPP
jgi:hypothetical protein